MAGYYAIRGQDRPSDIWTVVRDTLQEAVMYE